MSSNSNLSTFVFDDEELVIYPGSRFSKQELKARLKEMGINYNNNQDREYLKNLYDSAITDYKNRVSIIRRIKRDTEILNSKLNQSQKESMINNSNINNYSNDLGKNKLMNLSYDIDKIYQNANNNYYQNFIQQNNNERQNYNNGFNNNINNINNYNRNAEFNRQNDSNDFFNNNKSFTNKQYEEINTNINENNYNNNNKKANNYNQYQNQDNTNKNIMNKPYMQKRNKNMFTIPESQYENDNDEYNNNNINNNINNYNYQRNYNKIEIIPQRNILKNNNTKVQPYQSNISINSQNNEYTNNNNNYNNQNNINREISNRPSFLNNINKGIAKYDTKTDENEENNNNRRDNTDNDNDNSNKNIDETIDVIKSPDEVSTFSFFSAFENIKKTPLIKNWKFILIHLLILISILILFISLLHIIYNNRQSISDFFSSIYHILCQPRLIFESIRNFIYMLFFGSMNYWYVIIPLFILGFVFYFYVKKYLFKKRCEEIKEKIVADLKKDESGRISQDDIYNKYVKKYGVSYSTFIKKYLPRLEKLRKADNRLKKSSMIFKEKTFVFWELAE